MGDDKALKQSGYLREQATWYIKQWIGGVNPNIVNEALVSVGLLDPVDIGLSFQDLYLKFKKNTLEGGGYSGCMAFSFKDGRASRVEWLIDEHFVLSVVTGPGDRGLVKMRPLYKDAVDEKVNQKKLVDPFLT